MLTQARSTAHPTPSLCVGLSVFGFGFLRWDFSDCPEIYSVDQAGLKHRDLPASRDELITVVLLNRHVVKLPCKYLGYIHRLHMNIYGNI